MNKRKNLQEKIHEMSNFLSSGAGFGDPDALQDHLLKLEELKHREKIGQDKKAYYIAVLSLVVAIISLIVTFYK